MSGIFGPVVQWKNPQIRFLSLRSPGLNWTKQRKHKLSLNVADETEQLITSLLSERGFKFLRNKGAELKFDDGASEETNLDSLMMFYREWAHYLHPNLKFTDFVVKVKKECSSKTMREYMAALRREATHSTIDEGS